MNTSKAVIDQMGSDIIGGIKDINHLNSIKRFYRVMMNGLIIGEYISEVAILEQFNASTMKIARLEASELGYTIKYIPS